MGVDIYRHVQTKGTKTSPEGVGKPVCWALQPFEEGSPSVLLSHLTGRLWGHHPLPLPVRPQPRDSILHPGCPLGWPAAGWVWQSRGREWVCTAARGSITCRDQVAANCSATALHLSLIPTMCSDTPSCAPCVEDLNAWLCTMSFFSL